MRRLLFATMTRRSCSAVHSSYMIYFSFCNEIQSHGRFCRFDCVFWSTWLLLARETAELESSCIIRNLEQTWLVGFLRLPLLFRACTMLSFVLPWHFQAMSPVSSVFCEHRSKQNDVKERFGLIGFDAQQIGPPICKSLCANHIDSLHFYGNPTFWSD